jgi:hypothetical protein
MPKANRYFLAGSSWYISLTAATKTNSHGSFPAIDADICIGFSKPGSEKLSQDSFGSYFRFPFNLTYFNNRRKIFQHDCPKSARSFVALSSEAFGVWQANAAAMSPKLLWRKA